MTDLTPAIDYINMVIADIAQPDDRSKQVKIGPSGLGDPCDHCVAEQMARQLHPEKYVPDEPNLRALTGTAWHLFLEKRFVGPKWDAIGHHREMKKLKVGSIEDYGEIVGTADAYSEEYATVLDWKTASKANIQKYKRNGLSQTYEYQRHIYGRGVQNAGLPIKFVGNVFIPPDGYFLSDIWYDVVEYDPTKADRALARASVIFHDYVLTDKIDDLGSDEDCFTCNRRF